MDFRPLSKAAVAALVDALHLPFVFGFRNETVKSACRLVNSDRNPCTCSLRSIDTEIIDEEVVHVIIHMVDGDVALLSSVCAQVDDNLVPFSIGRSGGHCLQSDSEAGGFSISGGKQHFVTVRITRTGSHIVLQYALEVELRCDEPVIGIVSIRGPTPCAGYV